MKPLAALLGAAARDAVFLDVNSIKPGDLWKQEIDSALQDAAVFILCWCCESQASDFVGYEIRMAIENRAKRVVPVRLCSSPLPNLLSDRQWIDLRGRIVHDCRDHIHMEKKANEPVELAANVLASSAEKSRLGGIARFRWLRHWGGAWATILALTLAILVFTHFRQGGTPPSVHPTPNSVQQPKGVGGTESPSPPPNASPVSFPVAVALISVLVGVFVLLLVLTAVHRRLQHHHADRIAATAESYFEKLGKY